MEKSFNHVVEKWRNRIEGNMDLLGNSLRNCWGCFESRPDAVIRLEPGCGCVLRHAGVPPPHSTEQYSKCAFLLTCILWLCFSSLSRFPKVARQLQFWPKQHSMDWIRGSPAGISFGARAKIVALQGWQQLLTAAQRPCWALHLNTCDLFKSMDA